MVLISDLDLIPDPGTPYLKEKKKSTNNNAIEDVERKESSYTVGGNVNWRSHYREQYGGSIKN